MAVELKADARRLAGTSRRSVIRDSLLRFIRTATGPFVDGKRGIPQSEIRKVLFIRPDHLGDMLFTTPALERWRRHRPAMVEATLSLGTWNQELLRHLPPLEHWECYSYPGFARARRRHILAPYMELIRQARRLRRGQYDLAVILRFDHWWGGLLAYVAGIPIRVGYDTSTLGAFLTDSLPYEGKVHEVERNLVLIELVLALCGRSIPHSDRDMDVSKLVFHLTEEDREEASALLGAVGPQDRLVTLHAGAGAPVKQWPAERFAAVGDELAYRFGVQIVLTGSAREADLTRRLAGLMKSEPLNLSGRTSLGTLAGVMERSALAIGADCGPMHLAVAVGTPSLHLYGPVDPDLFGPWSPEQEKHRVIMSPYGCRGCNHLDFSPDELEAHHCMEAISVERVLEAAGQMLSLSPVAP